MRIKERDCYRSIQKPAEDIDEEADEAIHQCPIDPDPLEVLADIKLDRPAGALGVPLPYRIGNNRTDGGYIMQLIMLYRNSPSWITERKRLGGRTGSTKA